MSVLMMNKRRRKRSTSRTVGKKRKRRRSNPLLSENARRRSRRRRNPNGGQSWNMMKILTGAGAAIIGGIGARYLARMVLRTKDIGTMGYMANAGLSLGVAVLGTMFVRGKMARQLIALTAIGGLTATGLRFVNDQILRGQLAGGVLSTYVPYEETPLLGHLGQMDIEFDGETPEFQSYVEDDSDLNI